ncbi:hypothetical protein [Staphylococcus hominis]|uniref:hypothetical protein n=1 Tax=Staphylococcus hominis TaxID=1290 RepID=UPI002DD61E5C|nr:hypothetical protein [Staphylococcus hominis]WRY66758.1 hypothetical protein P8632_05640 [Staphylococcus hominis]
MLNIENLTNTKSIKISKKLNKEVAEYFQDFEDLTEIEDQELYKSALNDLKMFLTVNNLSFKDIINYYDDNDLNDENDIYRLLKYLYYFDNVKDYQEFINNYVTNFKNEISIINKTNYILIAYVPDEE